MRQNPHVRICGGPGSATTLVYPTTPRSRDTVSISPSRFGAPARAPACTSSLTAPDCPSSAKVRGPRRNMGAEGDAAGGSSISAWTGPV